MKILVLNGSPRAKGYSGSGNSDSRLSLTIGG